MTTRLSATLVAAALAGLAVSAQTPETPDDWPASPHGEGDRIGAANHLTPEKTASAARLVSEGKTYGLGMVTGPDTPAYGPREYDVTVLQLSDGTGTAQGTNKATGNDDLLRYSAGIGSQIDGLGHMGIDHVYYNGTHASQFVTTSGLTRFSTHEIPPMATRGILLDMTEQFGRDPVAPGTAFNRAEIEAALAANGLAIEPGDVVLFHTGTMAAADPGTLEPAYAGLGREGAAWLAEQGVVAVGADTWGLEVIPFETEGEVFPVHQTLLAHNGVYILENMVTEALAADGVSEFYFVLGVPRLEGTVQSVINPVAIR